MDKSAHCLRKASHGAQIVASRARIDLMLVYFIHQDQAVVRSKLAGMISRIEVAQGVFPLSYSVEWAALKRLNCSLAREHYSPNVQDEVQGPGRASRWRKCLHPLQNLFTATDDLSLAFGFS